MMPMLVGKIVKGDGRGRSLGFPTANFDDVDRGEGLIEKGVYAALAGWDDIEEDRPAVVNVGVRPTFADGTLESPVTVEVHILDFSGDLYGKTVRLRTVSRLRDERRFVDGEELVEQLIKDVKRTREVIARGCGVQIAPRAETRIAITRNR